jgi:hypothetical protein
MKPIEIKIEPFRSKLKVNMTDDMVRISFCITRNKWRQIRNTIASLLVSK